MNHLSREIGKYRLREFMRTSADIAVGLIKNPKVFIPIVGLVISGCKPNNTITPTITSTEPQVTLVDPTPTQEPSQTPTPKPSIIPSIEPSVTENPCSISKLEGMISSLDNSLYTVGLGIKPNLSNTFVFTNYNTQELILDMSLDAYLTQCNQDDNYFLRNTITEALYHVDEHDGKWVIDLYKGSLDNEDDVTKSIVYGGGSFELVGVDGEKIEAVMNSGINIVYNIALPTPSKTPGGGGNGGGGNNGGDPDPTITPTDPPVCEPPLEWDPYCGSSGSCVDPLVGCQGEVT